MLAQLANQVYLRGSSFEAHEVFEAFHVYGVWQRSCLFAANERYFGVNIDFGLGRRDYCGRGSSSRDRPRAAQAISRKARREARSLQTCKPPSEPPRSAWSSLMGWSAVCTR